MQGIAALGGVGGGLQIEVALGLQLPARAEALTQIFEPARACYGRRQVVEVRGQLANGPGSLTISGATWSAAAWRSLLVLD